MSVAAETKTHCKEMLWVLVYAEDIALDADTLRVAVELLDGVFSGDWR